MSGRRRLASALAPVALALVQVPAAGAVSPTVPPHPSVRSPLEVSFSAPALAEGGYYYAVVVLGPYRGFTGEVPPACSTSSEMQRTAYGHPDSRGRVTLRLSPARSDTGRWCPGGRYEGAVYAVPHEPPCEGAYPCRAEPYKLSPCWGPEGHRVCGIVAPRTWRYPQPLPAPLAPGTKIVAHFKSVFPSKVRRRLHLTATVRERDETLDGIVTSHESLAQAGKPAGRERSRCEPASSPRTAHCTGHYYLPGGTIAFAGAVAAGAREETLTITGGTGRFGGAEGSVLIERGSGAHAHVTIALEG